MAATATMTKPKREPPVPVKMGLDGVIQTRMQRPLLKEAEALIKEIVDPLPVTPPLNECLGFFMSLGMEEARKRYGGKRPRPVKQSK